MVLVVMRDGWDNIHARDAASDDYGIDMAIIFTFVLPPDSTFRFLTSPLDAYRS
jgi:hypothetical protein